MNFTVKYLKEDERGYASTLYIEMEGSDSNGNLRTSGMSVSFGGADYKPKPNWTQDEIDAVAEAHRATLEQNILQTLEGA